MSLTNRRKTFSMNYVLKLKTCPAPINPAYSCVFKPPNPKPKKKKKINLTLPPWHSNSTTEDSKIDLDAVGDITVSDTPPWSQSEPQICFSLAKY